MTTHALLPGLRRHRWIPPGAVVLLLGAALGPLPGQDPPPLPSPKPITVRPIPKPGEFSRPPQGAPGQAPVRDPSGEPPPRPAARKEAPPASAPGAQAKAEPAYGSTPIPWPEGSTDPAHFPKGIPRVPTARRSSYSMSANTATAFFICPETPEEIARRYTEFAVRETWDLVPLPGPPLPRDRVVLARKGDWTLRVDACPNPLTGSTEVFLMVLLKPLPPPRPEGKAGRGTP